MAKQKIYKVSQKIGEAVSNQFFGQEAASAISNQLLAMASPQGITFTVSTIEIDTSAVNLDSFLKTGGILVGLGELSSK